MFSYMLRDLVSLVAITSFLASVHIWFEAIATPFS